MSEEEHYTVRQLDKKIEDQSNDLKEHIVLNLKPILDEVQKTNGRVTSLEGKISDHRSWRTGMTWGGAVLFFFMTTFVFPVLTWNILETIQLKNGIREQKFLIEAAVQSAFNDYEVTK